MSWKKFVDEMPPKGVYMWVYDGKDVSLSYSTGWIEEKMTPDDYWILSPPPVPPPKAKHKCSFERSEQYSVSPIAIERSEQYYCYERDGRLYIRTENCKVYPSSIIELEAKYCPFCAFTLEEK